MNKVHMNKTVKKLQDAADTARDLAIALENLSGFPSDDEYSEIYDLHEELHAFMEEADVAYNKANKTYEKFV